MKRSKIILIIILLMLIVVPLSVFASPNIIEKIPIVEYGSEDIKNEKLSEKPPYVENSNPNYSLTSENLENLEFETNSEYQDRVKKIENLLKKYYPDECSRLQKEFENTHTINEFEGPYVDLYNLILDVIEKEDLSEEDRNLLKNYMIEDALSLTSNTELMTRINTICNN